MSRKAVTPQLMRRAGRRQRIGLSLGVWLVACLSSLPAHAQTEADEATVVTAATGEVSLAPDHARLTFGIVARRTTAAEAATVIAGTMSRIRDSLVALGIPRDSVAAVGYTIRRERRFDTDSVLGYDGETSVVVEIRDFALISRVIEAVIGAGANNVRGIDFRASDQRSARDRALRLAVEEARRDVVALAEAAGRELGELVELSTIGARERIAGAELRARQRMATETMAIEVIPRDITVRVQVTARWRLRD
jgi:uncharacterized protein YggE